MATMELSMTETMKNVSLHVVVTDKREASARMWFGTRLIKLAARVMGCGVDVEVRAKPVKPDDWRILEEGQTLKGVDEAERLKAKFQD